MDEFEDTHTITDEMISDLARLSKDNYAVQLLLAAVMPLKELEALYIRYDYGVRGGEHFEGMHRALTEEIQEKLKAYCDYRAATLDCVGPRQ